MNDAIQTVADGIAQHWPVAVAYAVGAGCGFVAGIRIDRLHDMPDTVIDLIAGAIAGLFTFLIAAVLMEMPQAKAAVHGAINAVVYIVVIAILMAAAEQWWPRLYKSIRSRGDAPGTAPPDNPDDPTRYL